MSSLQLVWDEAEAFANQRKLRAIFYHFGWTHGGEGGINGYGVNLLVVMLRGAGMA